MSGAVAGVRRDAYLDGIRGVGCTLVVVWHTIGELAFPFGLRPVDPLSFVWITSTWGATILDIFFVLSGFFITRILLEHRESASYFRTFWLRRAVRILPAAYAVLFALAVVRPWLVPYPAGSLGGTSTALMWPLWTLTSNIVQATGHHFGFFDHYWSIALEEQFYLLWPIAVLALSRRSLERLCLAMLVTGPVLRFAMAAAPFANYALIENQLFTRADGFAAGALIVLMEQDGRPVPYRWPAAIGALMLIAVLPDGGVWINHPPTALWSSVGHSGMVLLTFALVASRDVMRTGILGVILTNRVSLAYGQWSYCLYLVHFPIVHILMPKATRVAPAGGAPWLMFGIGAVVGMVIISGAAAAALHYLVERAGLRLYRYLRFAPPPQPVRQLPAGRPTLAIRAARRNG